MTVGEYLTSNTGISYPFKQDQDIPDNVTRIFADASVSATTGSSVSDISYDLGTDIFRFKIGGKEFRTMVSGKHGFGVVGTNSDRVVLDFDFLGGLGSFEFERPIILEDSCVDRGISNITSIEIYNGENDPRNAIVSGDVLIENGYNIDMALNSEDRTIQINSDAGAGLGSVPCDDSECEDDPDTAGTRLPEENGNAVIAGDGCYEITAKDDTVKIHGKCVACCQCQMYVDVVNELKAIAHEVVESKDRTNENTNLYFNTIEKASADSGRAEVDIQLDVSPDATILHKASVKSYDDDVEFNDFQAFRVTCTVTNLSGLPCVITTPDLWSGSEYSKAFSGKVPSTVRSRSGIILSDPKDYMECGIAPFLSGSTALSLGRAYIPSRTYYYDHKLSNVDNENGWTISLRSRGPAMRIFGDGSDVKYYEVKPLSQSPYEGKLSANFESAKSALSDAALRDLNKGVNPSSVLDYAYSLTHTYAEGLGFEMPAGYSYTTTGVYALPGDALENVRWVGATFSCAIFCPVLAYSLAYNHARPSTSVTKKGNDYVVNTTWEHGPYEDAAISMTRLARKYHRSIGYNIVDGKTYLLYS